MSEQLVAFGSGNVFKDLGVPNPEEHMVKAGLAMAIMKVSSRRGLTQSEVAGITGVPQPRISAIMRGRFRDVSAERMLRMLNLLGVGARIVLSEQPNWDEAETSVEQASA